jgi:hypothetical protein
MADVTNEAVIRELGVSQDLAHVTEIEMAEAHAARSFRRTARRRSEARRSSTTAATGATMRGRAPAQQRRPPSLSLLCP